MSTTRYINGQPYLIPDQGDSYVWGTDLSNFFGAVSTSTLQKNGGPFPLTADVDFGPNYGLKPVYLSSRSGAADSGLVRLNNTDAVKWRNAADTGNNTLALSGDTLTYSGAVSATSFAGNGAGLTNVIASALSFVVPVAGGGTGATTAAGARTALNVVNKGGDQMAGALDNAAEYVVASAATVDLSLATSNDVQITGSTNISSFGTAAPIGTVRNLRFNSATPGGLVCGNGSTAGTIGVFQGTTAVGDLLRCYTNDVITVRKFDNGIWYVVNQSNLVYNSQVWEKIGDWTPTNITNINFGWEATRYRRVRISVNGVRMSGTGTAGDILYGRVYQSGVIKSGPTDYFAQGAYWNAAAGAILTGTASVLHMSIGGQNVTPEELHGEFLLDCPPTGAGRGAMHGQSRYLNNAAERGVAVFGHQILAQDAAINGMVIGWANGGSFLAGFGTIVLEGLRR